MKKTYLLITLLLFLAPELLAQVNKNGLPLIQYYSPAEMKSSEQNWCAVTDQRGVLYVGNNDDGVLEYDGSTWRKIAIPNKSPVFSLVRGKDGRIFVGAIGEFGYLEPDPAGLTRYHSLIDRLDSTERVFSNNIWKTYRTNKAIYFDTPRKLYKYNYTDSIHVIELPRSTNFSFLCRDRIFIGNFLDGLLELVGDSVRQVPGGSFFKNKNIFTLLPWKENMLLVGAGKDGLYGLDLTTGDVNANPVPGWVNSIFKEAVLYDGIQLARNRYSFSSLYGGGIFVLDENLQVINHFNTDNGLLKPIVVTGFSDGYPYKISPLWYSQAEGLVRIDYNSSFRILGDQQGIRDFVMDIRRYKGKIYIATFTGTFVLTYNELNQALFMPLEETQGTQNWKLLPFKYPDTGKEVLLIGTHNGIFELDANNKIHLFDDQVTGKNDPTERFVVFNLYTSPLYPEKIFISDRSGAFYVSFENGQWVKREMGKLKEEVRSVAVDKNKDIWISTLVGGLKKVTIQGTDTTISSYGLEEGLPSVNYLDIVNHNDRLVFCTGKGLYKYDASANRFVRDDSFGRSLSNGYKGVYRFSEDREGKIWLFTYREKVDEKIHQYEVLVPDSLGGYREDSLSLHYLPNTWADAVYPDEDGIVWFGLATQIYTYDPKLNASVLPEARYENWPFYALVRKVTVNRDSVLFNGNYYTTANNGVRMVSLEQPVNLKVVLPWRMRNLDIQWSAPFFENEKRTLYSYRLLGSSQKEWSDWTLIHEFPFYNLGAGHYTFQVKARNVYGQESLTGEFAFAIKPPWYFTVVAFILYGLLAVFIVYVIVRLNARRLVMEKIHLEGIVRERTAEVVRQKDEIEDSIHYASRIQQALLPIDKVLDDNFPDHFILFKPRDIVSGDFYWMTQKEEKVFLVAADCTGHGVPGAFMSMLGISFFNEIVNIFNEDRADVVLNHLRELVMTTLKQTGKAENETKDGMDLALLIFDKQTQVVQYAGAYNNMYLVRPLTPVEQETLKKTGTLDVWKGDMYNDKNILIQYDADKMPIGISAKELTSFTNHEIPYKPGYTFYISSDGYIDQFGGPAGKKFMSRNLKAFLLSMHDSTLERQGKLLDEKFYEWKGNLPQVDDIIIIGVRVS
jgi:serine phosphatase RsbU (regulator of sigma subunit)/ligand-binding sensor domain-containing protein